MVCLRHSHALFISTAEFSKLGYNSTISTAIRSLSFFLSSPKVDALSSGNTPPWQAENGEAELARHLFERLLERTQHVKVRWLKKYCFEERQSIHLQFFYLQRITALVNRRHFFAPAV